MSTDPHTTGTIGGNQIVQSYPGPSTGDRIYQTADGSCWRDLRGVVPNTLATGDRIELIKGR